MTRLLEAVAVSTVQDCALLPFQHSQPAVKEPARKGSELCSQLFCKPLCDAGARQGTAQSQIFLTQMLREGLTLSRYHTRVREAHALPISSQHQVGKKIQSQHKIHHLK